MIHKHKEDFLRVIDQVAMQTGFLLPLVEKDYYLTLILSRLHELSPDLVFKGGTCLNKIYFSYYRLSEDLDFSMRLPAYTTTRGTRRKCIQKVKDNIQEFARQLDMKIDGAANAGRNESKQYVYYFFYQSLILPVEAKIKLEISLRFNPILPTTKNEVRHKFLHPFTGELLFKGGEVNCLALNELVAEKLRAAATRPTIAPRDFYDIDFILRNGFNLADQEVLELFQKKLAEDGADTDLAKYRVDLGRSKEEIADMKSRIKEELFEVLTANEKQNFSLDVALTRINNILKGLR
ncbi:MAG: nucleotidyl transferase AbiEii/AbiGii toxin family protein [Kiritimatiellia bacterium]|nr:nucleotidyl transferase AbiEii/AbiGii toxin family protein [Kiritimatiellia bacterium]